MNSDPSALVLQSSDRPTLDQCIDLWIKTKAKKSQQTERAYSSVITHFRAALHAIDRELTSDAKIVALAAQGWASTGLDGNKVSSSTFNQRIAILSSFYRYTMKWELCMSNPIDLVDRETRSNPNAAMPMDANDIAEHLQAIDRSTPEGLRDFALLSVGITTGRRVNELAGMRWEHITISSSAMIVMWPHCKGAKVMRDELFPIPPRLSWPIFAAFMVSTLNASERNRRSGFHSAATIQAEPLAIKL